MEIKKSFKFAAVTLLLVSAYACNKTYELKGTVEGGYDLETYEIVSQNCYQCHANGNSEGDFGFIDDSAAMIQAGYITPDTPSQSPLYLKITNPSFGDKMPYKGPYLSKSQTDKILAWIGTLPSAGDADCRKLDDFSGRTYSWSGDIVPILQARRTPNSSRFSCVTCHNSPSTSKQPLTTATTNNVQNVQPDYSLLINGQGTGLGFKDPANKMIDPGYPCRSTLYRRASGSKPEGWGGTSWTMPNGGASTGYHPTDNTSGTTMGILNTAELTAIYNWIKQGALNN